MRLKRIFNKPSSKKGLWCPFSPILCQEGYCHECQIYSDWLKRNNAGTNPKSRELKGGSKND